MTVVEKDTTIDAPVETVFEYCESPDFLVDLAPSAVEVKDVEPDPDGGKRLQCVHEIRGQRFEEECKLTWSTPEKRIVETSDSKLLKSTTAYTFEPAEHGTKAEITADLTVPIPLVGPVAEALLVRLLLDSELESMLANLTELAEAAPDTT